MIKHFAFIYLIALGTIGAIEPALAYVGPGAGLSLLGALWGLVLAVGAALGFILMWPIRQARRRARLRNEAAVDHRARSSDDPIDRHR